MLAAPRIGAARRRRRALRRSAERPAAPAGRRFAHFVLDLFRDGPPRSSVRPTHWTPTLAATRRHPCRPRMVAADCAWFRSPPRRAIRYAVIAQAALNDQQLSPALTFLAPNSSRARARGAALAARARGWCATAPRFNNCVEGAYGIARFAEREAVESDGHARSTCGVRELRQPPVRRSVGQRAAAARRPTSIVCWWQSGDAGGAEERSRRGTPDQQTA